MHATTAKIEMTDADLLKRFVGERDQDAFEQLIRRYERLVWSVCHRILRNQSDAEDAFQTTFLVLATSAKKIRKPNSLSNWLYGVAWKAASRIRKRQATLSLDNHLAEGNDLADPSPSQLEAIARQYEIDLVDRLLNTMTTDHRTPLVLYYFAGLTAKQIANQLNLTVAAAEGRLRRARARLRNGLQNEGIHYSPLLLVGALCNNFVTQPKLVQASVQQCITAGTHPIVGASSATISLGTKLMIYKTLCAVGIAAILGVGGLLHLPADGDVPEVAQLIELSATMDDAIDTESLLSIGSVESTEGSLQKLTATCCDELCCPLGAAIAAYNQGECPLAAATANLSTRAKAWFQ